jgi:hypothetical protein
MIRKYKDLRRALKHQQMNQWLLNWEKIYAKTERLNLFNVQNDQCAYDFLNSLRSINLSFLSDKETILNHEMNQRKSSTSIKDFLEEFWNHLRIARTLITKKATHEAFATLQEKSSNENTTNKKKSEKFSNQKLENRKIENRSCLCDRKHLFKDCYYLIEKIRSIEWKSNKEIKRKSSKFSKRIRDFESQSNTLRKKSENDLKKTRKSRISTMNRRRRRKKSF